MKIAILGAAGVRTPLIVQAMALRQEQLGLDELALMDIDGERLDLIGALTAPLEQAGHLNFHISRTTDARQALAAADFVITTFRVGGIESRVVDERVPLELGYLGQETTGPGGFAMGLRSIPVILGYVKLMEEVCQQAWLVNFANPAGMLAEAVLRGAGWQRVVGICDAPSSMARVAAALTGADESDIFLDYFGLNHLGWVRAVVHNGRDYLPQFLEMLQGMGSFPGLPFEPRFLATLGIIPNEYLYYYYHSQEAVRNILNAEQTRGESIAALNHQLFDELRRLNAAGDSDGMQAAYQAYIETRGQSYMVKETGRSHDLQEFPPEVIEAIGGEGYAGVALDLVESLNGAGSRQMILNIPNRGAIHGLGAIDVVEIPAFVGRDQIHPLAVGDAPSQCLGLIQQVKAYEQLTIRAALEGSYSLALEALIVHPLVRDAHAARLILEGYIHRHGALFPPLH
jgi:6-phospho-beta-glucosidase